MVDSQQGDSQQGGQSSSNRRNDDDLPGEGEQTMGSPSQLPKPHPGRGKVW